MSAFICNDDLFDLLVTADGVKEAYQGKVTPPAEAQRMFDMLRQTNYDSVNFRYREHESPEPRYYKRVVEFQLTPEHLVQVRRAMDCYEYQSCEHPGWATSDAYRFLVNLGEWIDAELTKAEWVRVPVRHGGNEWTTEWLGRGDASYEWSRERGWPDFSEYPVERRRLMIKAYAAQDAMLNNPNIRRIL
jgi:hypothetical protein